jgi:hypothetical protein
MIGKLFNTLVLASLVSLVSSSSDYKTYSAKHPVRRSAPGKAAYLITNDAENAVAAMYINGDRTLSKGTVTPTGGNGSNVLVPGGTAKQAPDALVAQLSLTIAGNVSRKFLKTFPYEGLADSMAYSTSLQ